MFIDYHTHHERCGHAVGQLREYVEQAIEKGIDQLGLSDHMPIIHVPKGRLLPGLAMDLSELENYMHEALSLQKEYKKDIAIKVGLEADYIAGFEEAIKKLLSPYPFDYILGSVHFLGEWDLSDSRNMDPWKGRPLLEIYQDYFEAIQGAAKSGIYDIIGHFDVIKKYGFRPTEDISSIISDTLKVIKEQNVTIELNASGRKTIAQEIYPAPQIIAEAIGLEIPFTLGSDAHRPEDIHSGLKEGRELLRKLGVEQLATFDKRRRIMVDFKARLIQVEF